MIWLDMKARLFGVDYSGVSVADLLLDFFIARVRNVLLRFVTAMEIRLRFFG